MIPKPCGLLYGHGDYMGLLPSGRRTGPGLEGMGAHG